MLTANDIEAGDEGAAAPLEPIPVEPPLPMPKERMELGKSRRSQAPRSLHAPWKPSAHRADPLELLEQSNRTRLQELVPIRYGRMLASPFAFLRGSPIVMAHDLAATPVSGIRVQACGDAHLMNFGVYASPERNLLFDLNDFDETLPGPWEWDLKRLAASCVVAGRSHDIRERDCEDAARAAARSYRQRIGDYSCMRLLDIWYSYVDAQAVLDVVSRRSRKELSRDLSKARRRTSLQALSKLTTMSNGHLRIVETRPLVSHVRDERVNEGLRRVFRGYYKSLSDEHRALVERYRFVDAALKVVGVGSVGTRCYIMLFDASHSEDPLFLQIKEAQPSVLEPHAGPSGYRNHGRRVVAGQRLMQAASDIFLGWSSDGEHCYYVRQLRDMKGSANLATMTGTDLVEYAELCGWVLARAHARSGDAAMIAGYLGKGEAFDDAITSFAVRYADQTEEDYQALRAAVRRGRITADTTNGAGHE
jgi:uncharacterized protein (DUF2252 family)